MDVENYVKFYYTLIFTINENTMLEKESHELELKALEYHIRAMATLAGIIELENIYKTLYIIKMKNINLISSCICLTVKKLMHKKWQRT